MDMSQIEEEDESLLVLGEEEEAETLEFEEEEPENLLDKNTKSFRCLAQVKISRSSLLLDPFYWFPEIEDPHLENALWYDEPPPDYDNIGCQKYVDLCLEEEIRPHRRILENLEESFLDLSFFGLDKKEMKTICETLATNEYVTTVSFQENCFTPEAFKYINNMLQVNSTIKSLDLRYCGINPKGSQGFLEGFAFTKTLQELDLSHNELGDEGVARLAHALENNKSIKKLNLSHNHLRDGALIALAKVVEDNYMLHDLDLSWNFLHTADGMISFMDSLQENMSIKTLNLSWCGIGDRDNMRPIFNYLKSENAKLEELNLSNNRITGIAIKMLRTALKYNECLIVLNLSSNPMVPSEVEFLMGTFLEARETPGALTTLDFSYIPVNKSFIKIRNQCRRKGFTVIAGKIMGNYKIKGPNFKHILLERAKYVALNQKKKKFQQDFGIFLVCLKDEPLTRTDLGDLMKKKKIKMDGELLDQIAKNFANEEQEIDIKAMKEVYLELYPDTKPPEKKKKKKRGKKKAKKQVEEKPVEGAVAEPPTETESEAEITVQKEQLLEAEEIHEVEEVHEAETTVQKEQLLEAEEIHKVEEGSEVNIQLDITEQQNEIPTEVESEVQVNNTSDAQETIEKSSSTKNVESLDQNTTAGMDAQQ